MIEVGKAYMWGRWGDVEPMLFVVVAAERHHSSVHDQAGSEGWLALILLGRYKAWWEREKGPGDTFTFAKGSSMATNSETVGSLPARGVR